MIVIGVILVSLAVASGYYCYFYLKKLPEDRHDIVNQLGRWIYVVPLLLGIVGFSLARVYGIIGLPIGMALHRFVIVRWLPN